MGGTWPSPRRWMTRVWKSSFSRVFHRVLSAHPAPSTRVEATSLPGFQVPVATILGCEMACADKNGIGLRCGASAQACELGTRLPSKVQTRWASSILIVGVEEHVVLARQVLRVWRESNRTSLHMHTKKIRSDTCHLTLFSSKAILGALRIGWILR